MTPIYKIIYNIAHTVRKAYWVLFKPKTFGVKALILNPGNRHEVLMIQTSYGSKLWNLPGGGYNPKRETAENAIQRELRQELSVTSVGVLPLGEYNTNTEGKHDSVTLFLAHINDVELSMSGEVLKKKWFPIGEVMQDNVAKVARVSIDLYKKRQPQ